MFCLILAAKDLSPKILNFPKFFLMSGKIHVVLRNIMKCEYDCDYEDAV